MESGDDVIHFIAKGDDSEFVDSYLGGFWPYDDKEQNLVGETIYNRDEDEVYF